MSWPTSLPLVAILRGIRPDELMAHVDALVEAGFDCIEVPLNSPDWQASVGALAARHGDTLLVGAGTVLRPEQADAVADLGARLVVTPNVNPAVIRQAVRRGLQVCAGFATATEAFEALDAGAQSLKLFPASSYGPGHAKALRAVLPTGLPLLAVGGITPANLADYLRAGCSGAGLGSDLYQPGQPVSRTRAQAAAFVGAWAAHARAGAGRADAKPVGAAPTSPMPRP